MAWPRVQFAPLRARPKCLQCALAWHGMASAVVMGKHAVATELRPIPSWPALQVEPVRPVLDLATVAGRLRAVICVINLYRLLMEMTKALPPLVSRRPLWCPFSHGSAEITLTPAGATKKIKDIKAHLQAAGTTQEALKQAYEAAATAAGQQQQQQGHLPFLVCARDEDGRPAAPTFGARAGYTVHTTPLGYTRHIRTEEVSNLDMEHTHLKHAYDFNKVVLGFNISTQESLGSTLSGSMSLVGTTSSTWQQCRLQLQRAACAPVNARCMVACCSAASPRLTLPRMHNAVAWHLISLYYSVGPL